MVKPKDVTEDELSTLREYFRVSGGDLVANKDYGVGYRKIHANTVVGYVNKHNRMQMRINNKRYYVHRVIYYLHYGIWPHTYVDHIDGDKLNNHPSNLRMVSNGQNCRSYRTTTKNSSSKYRGVSWWTACGCWKSEIRFNYKPYYLGKFESEDEAALAYNYKALELGFNKEAFNHVF